jgi:hypothetical protein
MSQMLFEDFTGNKYAAPQHHGVYMAVVTDNHVTNPTLPQNTASIRIDAIGENAGWPPCPYVGSVNPPIGTKCVVSFEGMFGDAPRIIAFVGWQSPVITVSSFDPVSTYTPTTGDLWIQP